MAMQLEHITAEQVARYGVVASPDILKGTPADNKAVFDRLVRELVAVVVNDIIDKTNVLLQAEEVRENQEAGRVEAETGRVAAEELRLAAELDRRQEEDARRRVETERVAQETARAAAEALRALAEAARADENAGIVARATEQATRAAAEAGAAEASRLAADLAAQAAADDTVAAAAEQLAAYVLSAGQSAGIASDKAGEATQEADRAKSEADRAAAVVGQDFPLRTEMEQAFIAHDTSPEAHQDLRREVERVENDAKQDATNKADAVQKNVDDLKKRTDPSVDRGRLSYYFTFTAAQWADGVLRVPKATHGLHGGGGVMVQAWMDVGGTLKSGTWATVLTTATVEANGDVVLHSADAYAGAALLIG